jgi:hypothetical protein
VRRASRAHAPVECSVIGNQQGASGRQTFPVTLRLRRKAVKHQISGHPNLSRMIATIRSLNVAERHHHQRHQLPLPGQQAINRQNTSATVH